MIFSSNYINRKPLTKRQSNGTFSFNKEPPHTHNFLFITPMSSVTNPLDDLKPQEDPAQLDIEEDDDVEDDAPGEVSTTGAFSSVHLFTLLDFAKFLEGAKKKKKKKKPKKKKPEQSDPPRIGLSKIYPTGKYPEGEIQPYKDECVLMWICDEV